MSQLNRKQNASVFDIIGPNMVGPSSSHTAGALRISLMARSFVESSIRKVTFILYGSFAHTYKGHGTDKALLAGILGFKSDDMRIRDSYRLADEAGLRYEFIPDTESAAPHPNTVDIIIETATDEVMTVQGISIGGGQAVITAINGVDIELSGQYDSLMVQHLDRPGALAKITAHLSKQRINIAALKLYRESKGLNAFAIIEADERIPREIVDTIAADKGVIKVILIRKTEI